VNIQSARSRRDPEAPGAELDDLSGPPERDNTDLDARTRPARTEPGDAAVTPVWFQYIVLVSCAGVLSFGGFGLLLAVLGDFSAAPAFLLGVTGTALCTLLARPTQRRAARGTPASVTIPAAGMGVVAISFAIWNSIYMGHNVAVGSDPGVYVTAGRWLASHPGLLVPAGAPWAHKGVAVYTASNGMYGGPHGTLEFQFAHLLPVLLAEAHQIGGDALLFRVPAVLGALALCAIYAVGCRLVRRPWLVLTAVTALALSMPQLNVSRDTFSEPATQVLLWGGIWLLLRAYEERRPVVALISGLALGGTLMTRIDAVAYLVPLPLLAAVAWLASRSADDRKSLLRLYAALVAGVLPPAILGTIDVQRRSSGYYDALSHEMHKLYTLLGLCLILAVIVVLFRPAWSRPVAWFVHRRRQISVVAAGVVGIGLILAWSVRPLMKGGKLSAAVANAVGGVQRSEHLPVRPETFAEHSVQWLSWYLGPITMVLAIAGLCWMAVVAIRRGTPVVVLILAMAAPLTAMYLWNPDITPLQIWATRRYVPASLPLFVLAASFAVDSAASASWRIVRDRAWSRLVAVVGAVGMIVFPISTIWPVRSFDPQANFFPLVNRTCLTIGPNGAVLFASFDSEALQLAQTLRSWCNVPVASLINPNQGTQLAALSASFATEGKTLWILAASPVSISQASSGLKPVLIDTAVSPREIESTVDRAPAGYATLKLSVYGAKVP
jgi:hypothetical protein